MFSTVFFATNNCGWIDGSNAAMSEQGYPESNLELALDRKNFGKKSCSFLPIILDRTLHDTSSFAKEFKINSRR